MPESHVPAGVRSHANPSLLHHHTQIHEHDEHDTRTEPETLPDTALADSLSLERAKTPTAERDDLEAVQRLPGHFEEWRERGQDEEGNNTELEETGLRDTGRLRTLSSPPCMSVNPAHDVAETLRSTHIRSQSYNAAGAGSDETAETNGNGDEGHTGADRSSTVRAPAAMEGPLPDDDGMSALRKKLLEIRMLAISTEEKAQRMHFLMTQDYMAHRANLSPEDAKKAGAEGGASADPEVSALAPPIDPANPYNIRSKDLELSFSPLPVTPLDINVEMDQTLEEMDDELPELGCRHYKRNVKVQCFDCHQWYPCRHCHDQAHDLPFQHTLNRKKTRNMLCMLCSTPQPAAENCTSCGEYSAWYYCDKCKLWDNDSNKRIYHCDDCGICRVGEGLGKDYVHCRRCNVCISISTSAAHPCIERATEGNCPLCLVQLFESQTKVVSLPCGHYMHGDCYKDLMAVTYKCPVCSKSAVNMELQWRKLDDEIRWQPMPEDDETLGGLLPRAEDAPEPTEGEGETQNESEAVAPARPKAVWIGCNDCGGRCWTPFHWLGLKCLRCDSYNTAQMAPTAFQETEAERLVRQQLQQQHHRQHDLTGDAVLRDAGINTSDRSPVDSALDVPSSPSNLPVPTPEQRASGAQSPGRYFVQPEDQRRPSFSSFGAAAANARFSTPNLPSMPNLPPMPNFPQLPDMPRMPRMPNLPNLPNMPAMPNMPNMPDWGNMSALELSRFSPYGMFNAVSRSLSPMRYYLQGMDRDDANVRLGGGDYLTAGNTGVGMGIGLGAGLGAGLNPTLRPGSPTSVRSDPTADATDAKKMLDAEGERAASFWGEDGHFLSGDEERDGDYVDEEEESSEEEDSEDEEERRRLGDDEEDEGDGDMEIFGHR